MAIKVIRQKYFVAKELRLSIALIILWSLFVTAFFTYFAKELGEKIGSGNLLFVIIMVGYIVIIVVLTMLFSHRLIGPFQRLNTEMRLIRAGDYRRRLNVRSSDDIYIKAFVAEVNKVLETHDMEHARTNDLLRDIEVELIRLLPLVEEGAPSKERLREGILVCHRKLQESLKKN
ncbi:MAG: hypothetical protein JSU90_04100 [Nitrospiraceae bacterium]|nr:MAG: hypothetical protein JSU90_04100 [Nitrospiraceae bacterium]